MKTILISGGTGLIGRALQTALQADDVTVMKLVRSRPVDASLEVHWDPWRDEIDLDRLRATPVDAVVHLSGESLAAGRWTAARKERIYRSRIDSTSFLCRALLQLQRPPPVLASASATGYYGNRGDETVTEIDSAGIGFLAELCRDWELAAKPAVEAGIRVVHMRMGLVLSLAGGTLAKMLPVFKLGLGGRFGGGRQYMSWISLSDLVNGIRHCLTTDSIDGPVNLVSPQPVTNREFTRALGEALNRPTWLPVPTFALQLLFGREMTDEALLSSSRVAPARLLNTGFTFEHPSLEQALDYLLQRSSKR